jgi:heme/copper-type cytochrome/quinol oxidase subunit 1
MPRTMLIALAGAAVLVVGGVVTLLIAGVARPAASFGWFAYQPLAGSVFAPGGGLLLTTPFLIGAAAVVLGFVVLAGAVGFALGRRQA